MATLPEQRLFFALWPNGELRSGLARIRDGLPGARGRPTHPEDLHLTLVFLGAAGPDRQACAERAAEAVQGAAFDLTIDQLGYWARPRILWCGPSAIPDALRDLVADLQQRLLDCGIQPEHRPYAAHITLARKARPAPDQTLAHPLCWPVQAFALVASRIGGEPPHYQVLRQWELPAQGIVSPAAGP